MPQKRILVGIFGAPHGVRGELRLKSYTADPMTIAGYDGLTDETGTRAFKIVSARPVKDDLLVVRVAGVADRTAAEKLTNVALSVERDSLPPAEEDEFYHADLLGLRVETQDGAVLGTVANVLNFGAGDILDVRPPAGENLLLPFTRAVVPVIDLAGGRVVVTPPAEVVVNEEDAAQDTGEA
jgi:16S rRNA processing protein RimM